MNIRLSLDVVKYFKSAGSGWQSRIYAALRQYIAEHPQKETIEIFNYWGG